jgi:uncharacterized protein (DUF2141 family)
MEKKMILKKTVLVTFLVGFLTVNVFAENVHIIVEITGVNTNGGNVYCVVFSKEQDYKKDIPYTSFILESTDSVLAYKLNLPESEYFISAFQDTNGNRKLDTGFMGIPKEPVGISNYSGRGVPGGFNKHRVAVNSGTGKISVNLSVIKL